MFVRPTPHILLAANTDAGSGPIPRGPQKAEPGTVLGQRYQLISPIASGGMAQVWLAQDISLVRKVAIKILHPHLATDGAFVARFRREAVAAARLSHPSIVAVYDTLSEGGVEAIVMELIEGRTLRSVLDDAEILPAADVVDVGVQISDALDEAHRAGIVHRDIKPANIMVGSDRRIMVTDFGIAKANKDADLTHTGTLLGTAKYLAPEQVAGEPVDARADIYALGVVLFEAATGQPPFLAETDAATALARLQNEVPRCRHRRPSVPVGLDEVIARSMSRNPSDRFENAATFKAALSQVNLADIRSDTADLGPGVFGTNAPAAGVMAPSVPPGPNNPAAVAAPSGTAILPQQDDLSGPTSPRPKPNRKQRKADKRAIKARGGGRKPAMPIEGRQRPTKTLAAILIIGGLIVAALLLESLIDEGNSDPVAGPPPALVSAEPFDPPPGDGDERASLAPAAIDGDPETLWRTETYTSASLSGLKGGVGLILTLEREAALGTLDLLTGSEGWSAEVYVGEEFGPVDRPFDGDSLGGPVDSVEDGGETARFDLGGATGSRILIWITETGTTIDRNGNEVIRFVLYEATL